MTGAQETPVSHIAEALEGITSVVGLTQSDVLELLLAGLKVTDLLDYAEAVARNRLN